MNIVRKIQKLFIVFVRINHISNRGDPEPYRRSAVIRVVTARIVTNTTDTRGDTGGKTITDLKKGSGVSLREGNKAEREEHMSPL